MTEKLEEQVAVRIYRTLDALEVAYADSLARELAKDIIALIATEMQKAGDIFHELATREDMIAKVRAEYEAKAKKQVEEIIREIERGFFAEPQYVAQSGLEPVLGCIEAIDWQALKQRNGVTP